MTSDLVLVENGVARLSDEVLEELKALEVASKRIKEAQDRVKEQLLAEMEAKNVVSIKTEELSVSYIAPTQVEYFDKKKLRESNPDLYDSCITLQDRKGYVSVKIK